MELKNSSQEKNKYEMTVAIDAEAFAKAVDKAYRREVKKINIPGFRKGKAPRSIIEKMYGKSFFYEDTINDLLPEAFDTALKGCDIEYIGRPSIDIPEADVEKGATVKFTVELKPELTVSSYKGIEVEKVEKTVTNDDTNNKLNTYKEQASRLVTVTDRAGRNGDIANIDFEGKIDGVPFEGGKGDAFDLTLGSGQFIPGFEEQVVGHNVGDEFDVNVTFPEEYGAENLAGKDAVFTVKLNKLQLKEYPEIDDEFAKDVSEFDTLQELKDDIKAKLQKDYDDKTEEEVENSLTEKLAAKLEGEIPDVMVEDKVDDMIRDFDMRLSQQGLNLETYVKYLGMKPESIRENFKVNALNQVKARLALEAVARAEDVKVSDEDIDKEYDSLAEKYGVEREKVENTVTKAEIRSDVMCRKAIEIVKGFCKYVEPKPEEEPAAEEKAEFAE